MRKPVSAEDSAALVQLAEIRSGQEMCQVSDAHPTLLRSVCLRAAGCWLDTVLYQLNSEMPAAL